MISSLNLALQAAIFRFEFADVERALDQQLQRIGIDRLLIKIVSTHRNRFEGVLLIAMPGDHDHLGMR